MPADCTASLCALLDEAQKEKRQESALRRRVFETSLDLILVCDREGTLTEVSPSCQAILGYRPKDMVGRNARELAHPDEPAAPTGEHNAIARVSAHAGPLHAIADVLDESRNARAYHQRQLRLRHALRGSLLLSREGIGEDLVLVGRS